MTTITGSSSSGSYVDQLLGVSANAQDTSSSALVDAVAAATARAAADSSSSTTKQLGLSDNVLQLLQGTQGAAYMTEMLDNGKYSPVSALLGVQVSSTMLQSALSGARQKQYTDTLGSDPIGSLINANNAIANAASKAYLASITSSSTGTTVNTTDTSSSGGTSASGSGTESSDPYSTDPTA